MSTQKYFKNYEYKCYYNIEPRFNFIQTGIFMAKNCQLLDLNISLCQDIPSLNEKKHTERTIK